MLIAQTLAGLGGIVGAVLVLIAVFGSSSAEQQTALVGLSLATTVIPYVWFRLSQLDQQLLESKRTNELLRRIADSLQADQR